MTELPFEMFDADNHYYEAEDAFTRHLDPRMRQRCMDWAVIGGRKRLLVGGAVNRFIPDPTFDPVARPGCLHDYFRGENPEGLSIRQAFGDLEPIRPEYRDRDARLEVMTKQRVEKAIFFPTLGVGMEEALKRDTPRRSTAPSRPSIVGCSKTGASPIGSASTRHPTSRSWIATAASRSSSGRSRTTRASSSCVRPSSTTRPAAARPPTRTSTRSGSASTTRA
jgi:hypothetical protein